MLAGGPILLTAPKDGLGSVAGLLEHKAKLRGMCRISFPGTHIPGEVPGQQQVSTHSLNLEKETQLWAKGQHWLVAVTGEESGTGLLHKQVLRQRQSISHRCSEGMGCDPAIPSAS